MADDLVARQRGSVGELAATPSAKRERALELVLSYIGQADAASTRRVYASDWRHFNGWALEAGFEPLPAAPATLAAYLASQAGLYAIATMRRRLAAIARVHREAEHALDTKAALIRNTLSGIAREHVGPQRQAAGLTTAEVRRLVATCDSGLAGRRDRALLLGYAGALRRSELVGVDVEHCRFHADALELLIPRSKTDQDGDGARISIGRGKVAETCPVRALEEWLRAAEIRYGPMFHRVTQHGTVEPGRLSTKAVQLILRKRAALAGVAGTRLEPITPHGLRAGFVTQSYLASVRDEEIMDHTRHKDIATMRRYVRRAKLTKGVATAKLSL
ncbi:site-specific integrase [Belnapia rosea]|uniref:site-specific integrase n=1 Tax=Belnapia rosea TaxID=938405 RepID=UPI00088415D4|nr:site-specific integrase [Belnapia rosea]SDB74362.1 Site-specific recombinase XerD [Belnapia rosea]